MGLAQEADPLSLATPVFPPLLCPSPQVQPESLTIVASADTGNTYPIAVLPGTATELVWSPYEIEATYSIPWAVTSYTASMWDERGPTASATGGRMSVNSDITFALYRPQEYTPLSCAPLPVLLRPVDCAPLARG